MSQSPLSMPERRPRILIVDDERAVREGLEADLLADAFDVILAATGGEAIEALNGGLIDLVLLDIGLPDIHGFELHRKISKERGIPIIFLSARSAIVDRISGLELGGDDYIGKPYDSREVLARVRNLLRRVRGAVSDNEVGSVPWITKGGFEWAQERREIRYQGALIDLTTIEYDLLICLLRRPGVVYSRDQLISMVWPGTYSPSERTVDTHIKNLRAKLQEATGGQDVIGTSRNVGYFLKDALCDGSPSTL